MSIRLLIFAILCGATAFAAESPEKSDLRVLFVGHDPEKPRMAFADISSKRTVELYKERTEAFDKFLNARFRNVQIVYGSDYKSEMSNAVDVTIFDCRPTALTEAKRTDDGGYEAPTYLPSNFDRAALMISENSPLIGEPLGLKLDWL
ncbi:MAG: hypothetical protein AB8G99_17395 [Planctomycetaceae bacterium]